MTIKVPVGTVALNERGQVLGDLATPREAAVLARGGAGGSALTGSSTIASGLPCFPCRIAGELYPGLAGEAMHVVLELKSIADVGLVGFPNAGKSSMLRTLSHATPKVAAYPFTTLRAQVGVVEYGDYTRVRLADIPGLIEGAHANRGMGHAFLRHVERTAALIYVIDLHGFQLAADQPRRDALQCLLLLRDELGRYNETLLRKPALVVANKMDLPGAPALLAALERGVAAERALRGMSVVPVSLRTGDGVAQLRQRIRSVVEVQRPDNSVEAFRRSLFGLPQIDADKHGRLAASLNLLPPPPRSR